MKRKPALDPAIVLRGMLYAMLCALAHTLLGSDVFLLPSIVWPAWVNGYWVSLFADSAMVWANVVLVAHIAHCDVHRDGIMAYILAYPVIVLLNVYQAMPAILFVVLLLSLINGKFQNFRCTLIKCVCVIVAVGLFQQAALYARMAMMSVGHVRLVVQSYAIMNFDLILFLIGLAILDRKWGESNVRMALVRFHPVLRKDKGRARGLAALDPALGELSASDKAGLLVMQLAQFCLVSLAAAINGKFVVFLVLYLFGFLPAMRRHEWKYHAGSYGACCLQSTVFFYVLCSAVPQPNISMLMPVVAGTAGALLAAWYAYKTAPKPALDTLSADDLNALIEAAALPKSDAEFARMVWAEKLTLAQIESAVHYSSTWCKNKKRELRALLEAKM